ncbi:DCC1-like thiol-disulfide oxidoreductase family protein [Flavobacterium sp. SUN052]|uniref:thiol-disulfide oxidoreductase DCC family protein n=1 Tax=Flavobacterium sp. SUN052 TaxID=3002441 RepID=UPI00237E1F06|nr:DCC1-like thiol-disulfide oxidoreductase family protein [Flavobacterium sp. SUN052]MEC4005115.1 DCC1-like thiol-disulfide oxidoreductase family protein [Flavobacterium sp. SUN052]
MKELPLDKKIILFDGVCNLCENSVQFIIKHDKKDIFRYVSIQSEIGKEIINYLAIDLSKVDSIILYIPSKAYYIKANAVLNIAKELGGFISFISFFNFLPNSIKNYIYDWVAKNRYKWFGEKESCMLPSVELSSKFL